MLINNEKGGYHFLKGIDPYSCGVISNDGYEICHAICSNPIPWREGFEFIDQYLRERNLARHALCAVQLRSPKSYSMEDFINYNREYSEVLHGWDLSVAGVNPLARSHLIPLTLKLKVPVMHAFSYVVANNNANRPTFIVAGAGELLNGGALNDENIVCPHQTDAVSMKLKAECVMDAMVERIKGLGAKWEWVTSVDVYTRHPIDKLLNDVIKPRLSRALRCGVTIQDNSPPVEAIEFEMDMRGITKEFWV